MAHGSVPGEGPGQGAVPRLAPFLPIPVPALIAAGRPTANYPFSWSVLRWLDGDTPVEDHLVAPGLLAADLAKFICALRKIDPAGGPRAYQSDPLTTLNEHTLNAIERLHGLIGTDAAHSHLGPGRTATLMGRPGYLGPCGPDARKLAHQERPPRRSNRLRRRPRALSMALGHLPYYQDTNPVMAANARYTIREVFADYQGTSYDITMQDPGGLEPPTF
jgi:phosphotransferase family enzyme